MPATFSKVKKMAEMIEVVVECLGGILSPRSDVRHKSEEELKALEVSEDFGVVLAEVSNSSSASLPLRQLASVVLKRYIDNHWTAERENFSEPVVTGGAKQMIKQRLLASLAVEQSKIRAAAAYAISTIAVWEWPEEWPELFDILLQGIHSGVESLTIGSMQVLEELTREVTDQQVPHLAPLLYPELLNIISHEQVYSQDSRRHAVAVFETLTTLIFTISDLFPDIQKYFLPWIKEYMAAFTAILTTFDVKKGGEALQLFRDILSVLKELLRSFPKAISPEVAGSLQPSWNILVSSKEAYFIHYVQSYSSSGGLEGVLYALLDFISGLVEVKSLQKVLQPALPELLYHLITYIYITENQLLSWEEEPEKFLEDENDELYTISIRMSSLDLIHAIAGRQSLTVDCLQGLVIAVNKHFEEATLAKQQGLTHWWKIHEACMLVIPLIGQGVADGNVQFDISSLMHNVVLPDMTSVHPLLIGRCLWLSGKLVALLSEETLRRCLSGCVSGLDSSQPMIIRICAVMATHSFCCGLEESPLLSVVHSYGPGLLKGVVDLINLDNEGMRIQVFEALALLIPVAKEAIHIDSIRIVDLCTQVFLKCSNDPGVQSVLEEVFNALSREPSCREVLLQHFIPVLLKVLHSSQTHLPTGLSSACIDIWTQVLEGVGSPLPAASIDLVYPTIVQSVLTAEDSAILQSGSECVKCYLKNSAAQLSTWISTDGQSGLLLATKVVLHLLDPALTEFSAMLVGRLIVILIKQVGNGLGEHLETILRNLLSKLHRSTTPSVVQSLMTVILYLIHTQLEPILSFLEQVPDVSGKSSLVYVLTEWIARHESFYGKFESRLSTFSLSELLVYFLKSGDDRLATILVDGDLVAKETEGILTRSMRKKNPVKHTTVSLPQKVLKLLLADYEIHLERDQVGVSSEWVDQSDGEDEEDYIDSLAALTGAYADMMEEEECDTEFEDDPIVQTDLKKHLEYVLQTATQTVLFKELLPSLNEREVALLTQIINSK